MTCTATSPASTTNNLLGDLYETDNTGATTTSYDGGPAGNLAATTAVPAGSYPNGGSVSFVQGATNSNDAYASTIAGAFTSNLNAGDLRVSLAPLSSGAG